MQVTGMLYGAKLLQFVGFPASEVLGPSASEEEIKALVVAIARSELNAAEGVIWPPVAQLAKPWEPSHVFGMTSPELIPIRVRADRPGRLAPVTCDFKCGFDRDDPRWQRLGLPPRV